MTDLKIVDMPKKGKKPPRRVSDPDEKKAAIKQAMATYKKTHNSELSMNQADKDEILIQALPSGILSLDMIIGCGGYPQGRLIELFGKESSGKTTVALQAVASVQKRGGIASYVDVENSVNINYAENLGVVARELLLSQPDTAEDAFDTIETLVETGAIDLIVLDSVAALTPQSQIDGVKIKGDQEAIISERLRHLIGLVNKTKTVVIFINQTRPALDDPFAQRETTPGGPALKSYASVRLEVKEGEKFPETGKKIGNKATICAVKNKVGTPFHTRTVANIWGEGFSPAVDIVNLGVKLSIVEMSGKWYCYGGQQIGEGILGVRDYMKNYPNMLDEIEREVRDFPEVEKVLFDNGVKPLPPKAKVS